MTMTKGGHDLSDLINKAIEDGHITNSEYDEIMDLANKDGNIDRHETLLLKELQKLITEKIITRIPG